MKQVNLEVVHCADKESLTGGGGGEEGRNASSKSSKEARTIKKPEKGKGEDDSTSTGTASKLDQMFMLLQQLKASNEDQACKQAMKIKRSGSKLLKQTGQVIIAGIEFFKRKNPVISHQINLKGKNNATMDADFKTFCARIPLALANATRRRKRP